ncbi:hypothetical protein Hanom_Chr01g00082921 [Helianthus anomalus]
MKRYKILLSGNSQTGAYPQTKHWIPDLQLGYYQPSSRNQACHLICRESRA